jgi:hypothetical protein
MFALSLIALIVIRRRSRKFFANFAIELRWLQVMIDCKERRTLSLLAQTQHLTIYLIAIIPTENQSKFDF